MATVDPFGGRRMRLAAGTRRWAVTLGATVASTWVLDVAATAFGLVLAGSSVLTGTSRSGLAAALLVSYACWAAGLFSNLRANGRLLDAAGVSTNAVSKLAHDLVAPSSVARRRAAANWGYLATEAVKELPYIVGALAAAAASSSIGRRDAIVFLVGANLAAPLYELLMAVGTRLYLRRRQERRRWGTAARGPSPGTGETAEGMMLLHERRRRLDDLAAEAAFTARHPSFDPDGMHAALRRTEYGRLDATGSVYLDYTGGGLYASSQIAEHAAFLERHVLGNPHSGSRASLAATAEVVRARRAVLTFFGADERDYVCIFTANATAGLKLLGDAYPFGAGATFALTADNHNSVNGMRELARRAGAAVRYVPVGSPDLRVDRDALRLALTASPGAGAPQLFAFPAQSNYSGVQHPLDIVDEAHRRGWDVLLDASAYVPTNQLDLSAVRADFVVASLYKVCGFPTGVGCLLVRRERLPALRRPWFAGGTVTVASVGADGHYLHDAPAGFEDGTVDYLNLPAVTAGLAHVVGVGVDVIHDRVAALTGWLLGELAELRHRDGRAVVRVLGPTTTEARGGTVTLLVQDRDGTVLDGVLVESLANERGISLRSGCFCNPGAAEAALGIDPATLAPWFGRPAPVTMDELRDAMLREHGSVLAAVRVSFGIASNFADVHRLMCFLDRFVDRCGAPPGAGRRPPRRATTTL